MKPETAAVQEGTLHDENTGGMNSPIYTSSAYDYTTREEIPYPRYFNIPNQKAVGAKIAALEKGEAGVVFSSGMAAISSSVMAFAGAGDHVVLLDELYGGTHKLATQWFSHFGIEYSFAATDADDIMEKTRKNTRVIVVESPTNPLLNVLDIGRVARYARSMGIVTVMDNTFATPVNQNPLLWGMDIVVHSGTKYMGGHSDLCCGMVVSNREKTDRIVKLACSTGPSLDPRICYLLERSMKTLSVRVERQTRNAMRIAEHLDRMPSVRRVYYPGLAEDPGYETAKAQMKGFGGMISFELDGKDPVRLLKNLRLIRPAVSLGGVETTICSPALTSHAEMEASERRRAGITDSLLRLSVGIEHTDDIIDDMEHALK